MCTNRGRRKNGKRMRKLTISILLLAVMVFLTTLALAVEDAKHDYVGHKKCKTCHKSEHKAWLETGHAKAYDLLTDEEKKDEKCVGCHITGTIAKDSSLAVGVQCESCHGPGKDYKSSKIMNRRKWKANPETQKKMAQAAGLIYPTEETCLRCHNEKSPDFKEFDFEKRKTRVHPVVAEKTEE